MAVIVTGGVDCNCLRGAGGLRSAVEVTGWIPRTGGEQTGVRRTDCLGVGTRGIVRAGGERRHPSRAKSPSVKRALGGYRGDRSRRKRDPQNDLAVLSHAEARQKETA